MHIGSFLKFLSSARAYAKLDPTMLGESAEGAAEVARFHRIFIRSGKIGGGIGIVMAIVSEIGMFMYPTPNDNDRALLIFMPFVMIVGGVIGGASLAGAFASDAFLMSPVGSFWMKFVGTKIPKTARLVSLLVAFLVTGFFAFTLICIALGKM